MSSRLPATRRLFGFGQVLESAIAIPGAIEVRGCGIDQFDEIGPSGEPAAIEVRRVEQLADGPGAVSPAPPPPPLLFRPRWCSALPDHGRRKVQLPELTRRLPVLRLPPVSGFDAAARSQRINRAIAALRAS